MKKKPYDRTLAKRIADKLFTAIDVHRRGETGTGAAILFREATVRED